MSDVIVKMEESTDDEVVLVHPTKTIVDKKESEVSMLHDSNDIDEELETRGEDEELTKRDGDGDERDRGAPTSRGGSGNDRDSPPKQQFKKGAPSSPGVARSKNVIGKSSSLSTTTNHSGGTKHTSHRHPPPQNNARYYNSNTMPPNSSNMPPGGPRGGLPFPMARGYGGPPPYGGNGGGGGYMHSNNYGPPPMHYHPAHHHSHHPHAPPPPHHRQPPPHMMPPYGNGPPPPNGPYPGGPSGMMNGNYHSSMYGAPPPGPYGMSSYPPTHHGMNPNFPINSSGSNGMHQSDSNSISSKNSMNSKKKRTIDGLQQHHHHHPPSHSSKPTSYSFRRTDSNSSATSTATAGNNTSTETHQTDDSLHPSHPHSKLANGCESVMSSLRLGNSDHNHTRSKTTIRTGQAKPHYHRRDYSGASTASSLSVGGFSLSSYEKAANLEDAMMTDDMIKSSPKRHKRSNLVIDTGMRPPSSLLQPMDDEHDHPARFEQLSIEAKPCTSTDSESSAGNSNLFLSLSTSPINADVDATPNMKNTAKETRPIATKPSNASAIFKLNVEDKDRPSDTPTPPVHGELGDSEMNDDHSMLNRHLRGQSFTPLHHLTSANDGHIATSPTNTVFASTLAPQLSWSIAGDTPSLGDLAEWEEETTGVKAKASTHSNAGDSKGNRPSSTTSTDTRNMMISPHDFQMWKEEHELADQAVSGTTTPLPVFFEQSVNEQSENQMRFEHNQNKNMRHSEHHMHHMMYNNARKQHEHHFWPKHDGMGNGVGMPPTPMFAPSDYRDDFAGHSPMHGDRREMDYNHMPYPHHPGSNDRIRNLRGRMPPGANFPPMPLHIPPHISTHLPMTSPMGLVPGKPGMWSPHHGMCPPLGSPHHMGSPLNHMAQSKRKCVPLKPPIPSKFQGDMEKVKSAPVPEFTSLVNFPAHMSQKQSVNLPEGMRCCVMCGQACPCSIGNKGKKCKSSGSMDGRDGGGGLAPRSSNGQDHLGDKNSGYAIIPSQNKGLCTLCDVNVWVVANSHLEIKWCKGCKNFRPWAAFGDKGLATKCLRCRERQREKYALQKEEKEKTRVVVPPTNVSKLKK